MRLRELKNPRDCGRKLMLVILLLMVYIPVHTAICASSICTVNVLPYATSGAIGEIFAVNVTILEVQNLYGLEVKLSWDSEILSAIDVDVSLGETDSVLYKPIFIAENTTQNGQYLLAATSTSGTPFSGSGNVVRISFLVLSLADSRINLETQLYDYPPPDREPPISMPIDHDARDGFFDVTSPEIGLPTRIPQSEVYPEQPVRIEVNVTDSASGVQTVTLAYSIDNESTWETLAMLLNLTSGGFEAVIPSQSEDTEVSYKIIARDFADNISAYGGSELSCTYVVIYEELTYAILAVLMISTLLTVIFSRRVLAKRSERLSLVSPTEQTYMQTPSISESNNRQYSYGHSK